MRKLAEVTWWEGENTLSKGRAGPAWPEGRPGPTLSEIQFTVKFLKVERGPSHCLYFLNFISLYLEVLLI